MRDILHETNPKEVPVELKIPRNVERSSLSQLTIDIISFLLFQRQQIPEPVQLLERESSRRICKDERSSKSNLGKTRQQALILKQIQRFLETFNKLRKSLREAFDTNELIEISLLIGATPFSAKELFCIDLLEFSTDEDFTTVPSKIISLCSQKLCAALFAKDEFFLNPTAMSNVHIFIKAKRRTTMPGWQPWPQYKTQQSKIQLIIKPIPQEEEADIGTENKENDIMGGHKSNIKGCKSSISTNVVIKKQQSDIKGCETAISTPQSINCFPLRERTNMKTVFTTSKSNKLNERTKIENVLKPSSPLGLYGTDRFMVFCDAETVTAHSESHKASYDLGRYDQPCKNRDCHSGSYIPGVIASDTNAGNHSMPFTVDGTSSKNIPSMLESATAFASYGNAECVTYPCQNDNSQIDPGTPVLAGATDTTNKSEVNDSGPSSCKNINCQTVQNSRSSEIECLSSNLRNYASASFADSDSEYERTNEWSPSLKQITSIKLRNLAKLKKDVKTDKDTSSNLYKTEINSSFASFDCVDMELDMCQDSVILCNDLGSDQESTDVSLVDRRPQILLTDEKDDCERPTIPCKIDVSGPNNESCGEDNVMTEGLLQVSAIEGEKRDSLSQMLSYKNDSQSETSITRCVGFISEECDLVKSKTKLACGNSVSDKKRFEKNNLEEATQSQNSKNSENLELTKNIIKYQTIQHDLQKEFCKDLSSGSVFSDMRNVSLKNVISKDITGLSEQVAIKKMTKAGLEEFAGSEMESLKENPCKFHQELAVFEAGQGLGRCDEVLNCKLPTVQETRQYIRQCDMTHSKFVTNNTLVTSTDDNKLVPSVKNYVGNECCTDSESIFPIHKSTAQPQSVAGKDFIWFKSMIVIKGFKF